MPPRTDKEWTGLLIVIEAAQEYHHQTAHDGEEHHQRGEGHASFSVGRHIFNVRGEETQPSVIGIDHRRGKLVLPRHHHVLRMLPDRSGGRIITRTTDVAVVVAVNVICFVTPSQAHQILHHSASCS